jgi:hypothetical protein
MGWRGGFEAAWVRPSRCELGADLPRSRCTLANLTSSGGSLVRLQREIRRNRPDRAAHSPIWRAAAAVWSVCSAKSGETASIALQTHQSGEQRRQFGPFAARNRPKPPRSRCTLANLASSGRSLVGLQREIRRNLGEPAARTSAPTTAMAPREPPEFRRDAVANRGDAAAPRPAQPPDRRRSADSARPPDSNRSRPPTAASSIIRGSQ